MSANENGISNEIVRQNLSRRGLLGAVAVAGAGAMLTFGFHMTKEIEAQKLEGNSLYDQLGGIVGIGAVMYDFVNNVAADNRINGFFGGTVAGGRVERLRELLAQQLAEASGGPVKYLGLDMKTAHAGMGITTAAFNALVEDLIAAMNKNRVNQDAQLTLLGALAPMAKDIVEVP